MGAQAASAKAEEEVVQFSRLRKVAGQSVRERMRGKGLLTDDLGEGLKAKLGDLLLTGEDNGTRTVVQSASVGGGDGSRLLEDGLEGGELGGHELLVLLVLDDDRLALAVDDRHGSDLLGKRARGPGDSGAAVRLERERVLRLARDVVVLGRLLGAERGARISFEGQG